MGFKISFTGVAQGVLPDYNTFNSGHLVSRRKKAWLQPVAGARVDARVGNCNVTGGVWAVGVGPLAGCGAAPHDEKLAIFNPENWIFSHGITCNMYLNKP